MRSLTSALSSQGNVIYGGVGSVNAGALSEHNSTEKPPPRGSGWTVLKYLDLDVVMSLQSCDNNKAIK